MAIREMRVIQIKIYLLLKSVYHKKKSPSYRLPSARSFDKEYRPAKYNSKISAWKRKRFLSSPASIKKQLDHILGKTASNS